MIITTKKTIPMKAKLIQMQLIQEKTILINYMNDSWKKKKYMIWL